MGLFESLESEYVGGVTIPTQVIKYNHSPPPPPDGSDCSIPIKLNNIKINNSVSITIQKLYRRF